jgi:hypothetical protein
MRRRKRLPSQRPLRHPRHRLMLRPSSGLVQTSLLLIPPLSSPSTMSLSMPALKSSSPTLFRMPLLLSRSYEPDPGPLSSRKKSKGSANSLLPTPFRTTISLRRLKLLEQILLAMKSSQTAQISASTFGMALPRCWKRSSGIGSWR